MDSPRKQKDCQTGRKYLKPAQWTIDFPNRVSADQKGKGEQPGKIQDNYHFSHFIKRKKHKLLINIQKSISSHQWARKLKPWWKPSSSVPKYKVLTVQSVGEEAEQASSHCWQYGPATQAHWETCQHYLAHLKTCVSCPSVYTGR